MTRRSTRTRLGVALAALAVTAVSAPVPSSADPAPERPGGEATASDQFVVGRGVADVTGEVAEAGMMGYAMLDQTGNGLLTRQYSRAFVIGDPASGRRVVHVTADVGMIFQGVRDAVLARLGEKFGTRYTESNVMLTATHTHAGPGGMSHHTLYNITTLGYHPQTFRATVDGIVTSIERADADVAPATLSLGSTQLTNASANRSVQAFNRNPAADRAHFPNAVDPTSTTLSVTRNGTVDGAINWFAVHATSLTNKNRLISADNKGYAGYTTEHDDHGVDLMGSGSPDFVAAFAQTNAGDMSPNLDLKPGSGPTQNQFDNTRIIGTRMADAAQQAAAAAQRTLRGGVDSRILYVDMANQTVSGRFTPDGTEGRTCPAVYGAAFAAGSTEDGPGVDFIKEGKDGGNPLLAGLSKTTYTFDAKLRACQAPKELFLPVGQLDWVQQKLPVQLVRIGDHYLLGMPTETTIVAGLRLRQSVAQALGTDLEHVTLQGYANAYGHYLTTPQEYDSGEYEGASTLFGRNELPAFQQVADGLARDMSEGRTRPIGAKERDRSAEQYIVALQGTVVADAPQIGRRFGDVLTAPGPSHAPGQEVAVTFSGAHPNNNTRANGTYLTVERLVDGTWTRVRNDNDWSTRLEWNRDGISASKVTVRWRIEADTPPGAYRIRYFGDAKTFLGPVRAISGTSPTFTVTP